MLFLFSLSHSSLSSVAARVTLGCVRFHLATVKEGETEGRGLGTEAPPSEQHTLYSRIDGFPE